jgi:hypothetical protein
MGVECGMLGRDEKMHGFHLQVKSYLVDIGVN